MPTTSAYLDTISKLSYAYGEVANGVLRVEKEVQKAKSSTFFLLTEDFAAFFAKQTLNLLIRLRLQLLTTCSGLI